MQGFAQLGPSLGDCLVPACIFLREAKPPNKRKERKASRCRFAKGRFPGTEVFSKMSAYSWTPKTGTKVHSPKLPFNGRKTSQSSKDLSGLPNPWQNSAEPVGFCRRVLRNLLHGRNPAAEPSCRTPKVLQNFGSQAQLFRPLSKFFSHFTNPPRTCFLSKDSWERLKIAVFLDIPYRA